MMQRRLNNVRILVVEDDFLILLELEALLLEAGARIAGLARKVDEALAVIEREPISIALLDIRLVNETVAPVARELARRGIPFVFHSGEIEKDPVRSEYPNCPVIAKPAPSHEIINGLVKRLAAHQARFAELIPQIGE